MTASVQSQLEMSYASAQDIAAEYPQYATQITAAAKESFLAGDDFAYIAGIIAVVLGATLIFFKYPKKEEEHQLEAKFHAEDMAAMAATDVRSEACLMNPGSESDDRRAHQNLRLQRSRMTSDIEL